MAAAVEITGLKFNKLTVLKREGSTSYNQSTWVCECECGTKKTIPWPSLKHGKAKSCGCDWQMHFGDARLCSECRVLKPLSEFSPGGSGRGVHSDCKPCTNAKRLKAYRSNPEARCKQQRGYRAILRADVLRAYGEQCACCGESQKLFLAIDHIDNSGSEHRKTVGSGDAFYRWLRANGFPPGFQTLCCNCNWGKHANGGICPHKTNG